MWPQAGPPAGSPPRHCRTPLTGPTVGIVSGALSSRTERVLLRLGCHRRIIPANREIGRLAKRLWGGATRSSRAGHDGLGPLLEPRSSPRGPGLSQPRRVRGNLHSRPRHNCRCAPTLTGIQGALHRSPLVAATSGSPSWESGRSDSECITPHGSTANKDVGTDDRGELAMQIRGWGLPHI